MSIDMKSLIAEASIRLMAQGKRKITVRDIVDECHITRQAFYYHFADIPELMEWMITEQIQKIEDTMEAMDDPEERLKYLFLMALNSRKRIEQGIQSNYGKELERILYRRIYAMFNRVAGQFSTLPESKRDILVRYHSSAIIGLLAGWKDEDNKNLNSIVHDVYLVLSGEQKKILENL